MKNLAKAFGNLFIVIIAGVFLGIYYVLLKMMYWDFIKEDPKVQLKLGVFHLVLFMLGWSFVHCVVSEPGRVPPYWGFHMGDSQSDRKRYCLMCHLFKPDRCHHCSVCNRCILNMDHHCPWINNCIGFQNRKLFILLLLYALLTLLCALGLMWPFVYSSLKCLVESQTEAFPHFLYIGVFVFTAMLTVVILKFTSFHIKLVLNNSTTIEYLDGSSQETYDIGTLMNLEQVFGRRRRLWLFPFYGNSGKPIGDGIRWKPKEEPEVPLESERSIEDSQAIHSVPLSASSISRRPNFSPDVSYENAPKQSVGVSRLSEGDTEVTAKLKESRLSSFTPE